MISHTASNNRPKRVAQQLHLGKAAYHLYYRPKGLLEKTFQRGLINSAVDNYEKKKMELAAFQLPALALPSSSYDIHFLTGDRFWYQTAFCAYSMAQNSDVGLRPVIYDDGHLSKKYQTEIERIFSNAKFYLKDELDEHIETHLPQRKFPYLRERREHYPNIRKLIDIHAGSSGWKLVLDSDMLFFRRPKTLIDWLKNPRNPCHMVDVESFYGYSRPLMKSLSGFPVADRLNVGICGLNSSDIDWEKLEHWCKVLIEKEGTSYYQEQGLIAMLMAGKNCKIADETDYVVMPEKSEAVSPKAVLHHYVSDSKPWYFRYGWRHLINAK